MAIPAQIYVGIDVSKEKLDVALWSEKDCLKIPTLEKGIAKLVKQLHEWKPQVIVVEATGGYEEARVLWLFEVGSPMALVSLQRVGRRKQLPLSPACARCSLFSSHDAHDQQPFRYPATSGSLVYLPLKQQQLP